MIDKGQTVQVLDHGFVRLIDLMGGDESIIEAARMSTGKGFVAWDYYERCKKCGWVQGLKKIDGWECNDKTTTHDWEKYPNGDMGLLDTLWRKKHATPFEMCELVIEVQAPIFVFREWHRHRTQSYNEFSARYAQMQNLHYVPNPNRIQKQNTSNKQGSAEGVNGEDAEHIRMTIESQQHEIYESYDEWVEQGLAKEIARVNTPVSRYSKMRAKANIRNWLQFLNLRMRPDAQWEIRQYAEVVGSILKSHWPKVWELFEEYDLYGAHFSRTDLRIVRQVIHRIMRPEEYPPGGTSSFNKSSSEFVSELIRTSAKGYSKRKIEELVEKVLEGGDKILA